MEHQLRQSPMNKRTFLEVHIYSIPLEQEIYNFRHTGVCKKNSLTLPASFLAQGSTVLNQERSSSAHYFSFGEKREHVSEHLASPAVTDTAKGVYFSLAPFRVLNYELHD